MYKEQTAAEKRFTGRIYNDVIINRRLGQNSTETNERKHYPLIGYFLSILLAFFTFTWADYHFNSTEIETVLLDSSVNLIVFWGFKLIANLLYSSLILLIVGSGIYMATRYDVQRVREISYYDGVEDSVKAISRG